MRIFFVALLALTVAGGITPVFAQSNEVVVELYTSQGCSSCPPADDLLAQLNEREGVIPLALHVDYWDYIGWKDIFGDPSYTARQKSYARAEGRSMIYTPQMIIGGEGHVVGNKPMQVVDEINAARATDTGVSLELVRQGDTVSISAEARKRAKRDWIVQLVRYEPAKVVKITRGENSGKTIEYTNIVTDWQKIGTWDGRKPLTMSAKAAGDQPVVVIIQEAGPGTIMAAARLK